MEKIYDVVIIGGGPGGYTSALYCARAGLSTMVLEKLSAGGQMALTSQIDNYPGFEEGIDGFSLAEKMEQGAERFGAETELAEVLSVDFSNDIKIVESSEGTFKAKTVIIATGAVPRELGVPGEKELVGRGVGYCATCDGMFYRNKTVMVVGGGNTAAADAMTLSRIPSNSSDAGFLPILINAPSTEISVSSPVFTLCNFAPVSFFSYKNSLTVVFQ